MSGAYRTCSDQKGSFYHHHHSHQQHRATEGIEASPIDYLRASQHNPHLFQQLTGCTCQTTLSAASTGSLSSQSLPFCNALPFMPNTFRSSATSSEAEDENDLSLSSYSEVSTRPSPLLESTPGETKWEPRSREIVTIAKKFETELNLVCEAVSQCLATIYHDALPHCTGFAALPPAIVVRHPRDVSDEGTLSDLCSNDLHEHLDEDLTQRQQQSHHQHPQYHQEVFRHTVLHHTESKIRKKDFLPQFRQFVAEVGRHLFVSPSSMLGALILLDRCAQAGVPLYKENLCLFFVVALRITSKTMEYIVVDEKAYPPKPLPLPPRKLLNFTEEYLLKALHFSVAIFPYQLARYRYQLLVGSPLTMQRHHHQEEVEYYSSGSLHKYQQLEQRQRRRSISSPSSAKMMLYTATRTHHDHHDHSELSNEERQRQKTLVASII